MQGGHEPRLSGRLDPSLMFPAGKRDIHVRWVTLASGIRMRVAESGIRAQHAVLLLHGWGASIYMWRDWFGPLAAAGKYVLALDLPGHGLSDKPEAGDHYSLESMTAAVRELIAAEGLSSVTVIAQSMGGTIALSLAEDAGSHIAGLVLVNPAAFGEVRNWRLFQPLSRPVLDPVLPKLVSKWLVSRAHRLVYGDPSRITGQDEDETWAPSQFPGYARAMRRLAREFPWKRLPAGTMARLLTERGLPLLVVLGGRDRLVRRARPYVEALQQQGAALDLRVVEHGGHAVNEECPDEVLSHVMRFLDMRAVP